MEVRFCGWRRKKGGDRPWEHFGPADADTRARCYVALMDLSELVGHEGDWEYLILPRGQSPEFRGQTYRDRMLRPGGAG